MEPYFKGFGVPLIVDDSVEEPELSEEPYAVALRMSRADRADLERRLERIKEEREKAV